MGFQGSDSVDELILSVFSHFIASVATTDNKNRKVINAMSTAVQESYPEKSFIIV